MGIPVKCPIVLFFVFLFCCLMTPFSAAFDPCECDDDTGCAEFNYTSFYWGENCTLINMELVDNKTTPRTANFTWQRTPPSDFHANNYSIVRLETDDSDCRASNTTIVRLPLTMLDENTTRLIDLDFETRYVVCIMPNELASQIVKDKNTTRVCEGMRDCVEITTKPSLIYPYTLALYIISGFMIASVVGLIVLRVVCDLVGRGRVKPDNAKDRLIVDPGDGDTDDSVEEHTNGTLHSAAAAAAFEDVEPRCDGDTPSENKAGLKITAHA